MDLITELGFLVSLNQPNEINTFLPQDSKLRKLYDLIMNHHIESDEEAAYTIYNSNKADKKYLMLKRNLVKKLSDMVFLQDYLELNQENYKTIEFRAIKELSIAKKLLYNNVYHNPSKIIAKVEQVAEKYNLIDLQVNAVKTSRAVFSLKGYPADTQKQNEKLNLLCQQQQFVNNSVGSWEILYSKTKYTIAQTQEIYLESKEISIQIKERLKRYDSPFLKMYLYRVNILKHKQANNYNKLLRNINSLCQLFKKHQFLKSKEMELELNYEYAYHFLGTRQFELAKKHIDTCLYLSDYRAFDKFKIQELNFNLSLKQGSINNAIHILNEVYNTPQFLLLHATDRSAWLIRETYLYHLIVYSQKNHLTGKLPSYVLQFDAQLFLSETKPSFKDKVGFNILLQILRLCKTLNSENINDLDNTGSNMLMYFHRYMKEVNCDRTKLFFKHLAKAAILFFDEVGTAKIENRLLTELNEFSDRYDIYELIPYEELWHQIIQGHKKADLPKEKSA